MRRVWKLFILLVSALTSTTVLAEAPPGGRIGYVMTDLFWAVYQTPDGREECPQGFNDGPREEFAVLFPGTNPNSLPFYEVEGELSWGLNLDGESGPNDFTHPDGTPGIDNEVYRAVGCIIGFRGPDGVEVIFQNKAITDERYNRMMIELTGVDDLTNDDEVIVTIYRGLDRLLTDATGLNAMPGGSQRVDMRWGSSLVRRTTGRIEDSVLTTDPVDDMVMPWMNLSVPTIQIFRDARFQLTLTPSGAEGLLAGYTDVETYYKQLLRNDSTHHLSNGQISGISMYKALRRLADAHPDPATGENTAISTALDVKMVQAHIVHPAAEVTDDEVVTH